MKWFQAFLLFLLLTSFVFAQEDDDTEDVTDDGEVPAPEIDESEQQTTTADGVSTSYLFPDHLDGSFPAGKVVEALIGFENRNENDFHIEYIRGSLTSPTDFGFYIQNFTGALHNATVKSGDEATLIYRFKADASIDPREYGLLLEVFYTNDENETYLSTVYNSTITLTDPESSFDAKTIFSSLTIAGVIGFVVYIFQKSNSKPKRQQATRGRPSEVSPASPSSEDIDWDYIPAHLKKGAESPQEGKKTPSPTRKSPTRKN